MSSKQPSPKRGDIWYVNFNPTIGAEIKKTRPAVVVSSDVIGKLPIKMIVPVTEWKAEYEQNLWHVKINPDSVNNLAKVSVADVLQVRGVDIQRFVRCIGRISSNTMEEIAAAIAVVIEYQ